MTQWILAASASALAMALVLATAPPAAAVTDVVDETLNAVPRPGQVAEDARAAAQACRDAPGDACADALTGARKRDARYAASPALAWVHAFRADPTGALAGELAHMLDEAARAGDRAVTWLGSTLDTLGIGNPFGGDP